MEQNDLIIYQCLRPNCRFRFPANQSQKNLVACPKCGSPLRATQYPILTSVEQLIEVPDVTIEILLDNLRSSFNIGAILRSADGAKISHIFFCGITPTPDHVKVKKTSLHAERMIPWSQHWNSLDVIEQKKGEGVSIWCLENTEKAQSIFESIRNFTTSKILMVVGNEVNGIDPEILKLSDQTVYLPMLGQKKSFNVAVACSIAIYLIRFASQICK